MTKTEEFFIELLETCIDCKTLSADFFERVNALKQHDKHAKLKAQYALDVETCKEINGLEAFDLWQVKDFGKKWWNLTHNLNWHSTHKYRRHPHADNMIAYHKCSDADRERWQVRKVGRIVWVPLHSKPLWKEKHEYRLELESITIS